MAGFYNVKEQNGAKLPRQITYPKVSAFTRASNGDFPTKTIALEAI